MVVEVGTEVKDAMTERPHSYQVRFFLIYNFEKRAAQIFMRHALPKKFLPQTKERYIGSVLAYLLKNRKLAHVQHIK